MATVGIDARQYGNGAGKNEPPGANSYPVT
jgi:hypothetical protein